MRTYWMAAGLALMVAASPAGAAEPVQVMIDAGVTVTSSAVARPSSRLTVPPISATVFEFPISAGVR